MTSRSSGRKATVKDTQSAILTASRQLLTLRGHVFDVLTIGAPVSPAAAVNLAKIVSKLSPMLGNLIEFNIVEFLNQQTEFSRLGLWKRRDPGFPDTIFESAISPAPGFEIKTWFPLATEITARFKDSQNHFREDQTYVALLAWLPEHLISGKPVVLDVCVVSGASVAKARDEHYHDPPDYIIIEPQDTSARTRNLQQTNTAGYKWQGSDLQFREAEDVVRSWGPAGRAYTSDLDCQRRVEQLRSKFPYRLDTNFAKIDRVMHAEIEAFKTRVLASTVHGMTVREWARLLRRADDAELDTALRDRVKIEWTKDLGGLPGP